LINQLTIHTIFDTKIHITNSPDNISLIGQLYIESYSKGNSAQHIDLVELHQYLTEILQSGYALLFHENDVLKACLLYTPLSFDKLCPDTIMLDFQLNNCVYIAEVMVAEPYRGQGLGKMLLNEFFDTIDNQKYRDVFIRVWEANKPALKLYEKVGFTKCATIEQQKKTPDGKSDFVMTKIYLHKPLY
jgi:ribosomal protein S18 acetylase RimI-like enzyme